MLELEPVKGTYLLLMRLPAETHFERVGPFVAVTLPAGVYTYVGSAHGSGGVRGRVRQHLRVHK